MANGFGRGRGFGGGFGRGFGGGMGLGFRGSSPPWPYVGLGRGGLPRCGYFVGNPGMQAAQPYQQSPYPYYGTQAFSAYTPFTAPASKEEELGYLKGQAEAIKGELEQIETRMGELEAEG